MHHGGPCFGLFEEPMNVSSHRVTGLATRFRHAYCPDVGSPHPTGPAAIAVDSTSLAVVNVCPKWKRVGDPVRVIDVEAKEITKPGPRRRPRPKPTGSYAHPNGR